jgi:malonyl-CoA O-methyltransferase
MQGEFSLDRKALARAFDRAAAQGAGEGALSEALQRAGTELLERLRYFDLDPQCLLDLGAGRCRAALALQQHYPQAQVIALDRSLAMLGSVRRAWWPRRRPNRVAADAQRLPLRDRSVDLIYSNLLLPFCDQPHRVFRECARVLKEGGLFIFASLGPDTLQELRVAWESTDQGVHIHPFLNLPQLGEALMHSGLTEPVMDTEQHRLNYPDVQALMRDLKRFGAHNALSARARSLTGRGRLRDLTRAYEAARTPAGLPATFEVIFGAAFAGKAAASQGPHASEGGEVTIALSSLRHRGRPR